MKKTYICPEMEIVALDRSCNLLAGSLKINNSDASTSGDYYNDAPRYSEGDDYDF